MTLNEIAFKLGAGYKSGYRMEYDKKFVKRITDIANQVIDGNERACKTKDFLYGFCAPLTYLFWVELGKPVDFKPYSVMAGEEEHVLLYNTKFDMALDIAGNQFDLPFINTNPKASYSDFYRLSAQEIGWLIDG